MISAETSALVAGGLRAPAAARPVTLRVLRGVVIAGARVEPGAEIAVDKWFAAELVTAGKAERIADRPATPESAKPKKEATRAQQ